MRGDTDTERYIDEFWEREILPALEEYIAIPCKSQLFEPDWEAKGHVERALQLAIAWLERHPIAGAKIEIGRLKNGDRSRTPVVLVEIPGDIDKTVLLYGHMDKQPEMEGWREGLGPWKPVREGDKLYGRGAADDGYAMFAAVAAISALKKEGRKHARFVLLIEFSEESGSPDLPAYVDHYAARIGDIDLVVCLDSGAGSYDRLWCTTSLRGLVGGTVRIDVLTEGVHSGSASGIVPDSMRVLRSLISRLEDEATGKILPKDLYVDVPASRVAEAEATAHALGAQVHSEFPFVAGMRPAREDLLDLLLDRTWRPALAITGVDGIPPVASGGNVLRPYTTMKLSLRLPPTLPESAARATLARLFTEDPPYGAKVTVNVASAATGWNAPELVPWLRAALDEASRAAWGNDALSLGEGGTIPFMGMLGAKFPRAQFVVTGVLGPQSNAHGPNEFLHVEYAKKLTRCVTHLLAKHAETNA